MIFMKHQARSRGNGGLSCRYRLWSPLCTLHAMNFPVWYDVSLKWSRMIKIYVKCKPKSIENGCHQISEQACIRHKTSWVESYFLVPVIHWFVPRMHLFTGVQICKQLAWAVNPKKSGPPFTKSSCRKISWSHEAARVAPFYKLITM